MSPELVNDTIREALSLSKPEKVAKGRFQNVLQQVLWRSQEREENLVPTVSIVCDWINYSTQISPLNQPWYWLESFIWVRTKRPFPYFMTAGPEVAFFEYRTQLSEMYRDSIWTSQQFARRLLSSAKHLFAQVTAIPEFVAVEILGGNTSQFANYKENLKPNTTWGLFGEHSIFIVSFQEKLVTPCTVIKALEFGGLVMQKPRAMNGLDFERAVYFSTLILDLHPTWTIAESVVEGFLHE